MHGGIQGVKDCALKYMRYVLNSPQSTCWGSGIIRSTNGTRRSMLLSWSGRAAMATRVGVLARIGLLSARTTFVHDGMLGGQLVPSGDARARTSTVRPNHNRGRWTMPVRTCVTVYTVSGGAKMCVAPMNRTAAASATPGTPTSKIFMVCHSRALASRISDPPFTVIGEKRGAAPKRGGSI